MKNVLKNALIAKLNEEYFRNFQHLSELKMLTYVDVDSLKELRREVIKVIIKNDFKFISLNTDNKDSYVNLLEDLITLLEDTSESFKSDTACEIYSDFRSYQARISRHLAMTDSVVLTEVISVLGKLSKNSCLVGGTIRDLLTGKTPKDYDFVTDCDYDLISEEFNRHCFYVKETGKQFLVLTVNKNGEQFEIAVFRKDNYKKKPKYVKKIKF